MGLDPAGDNWQRPQPAGAGPSWSAQQPNAGFPGQPPPSVTVRTYSGSNAQQMFQQDAAQMSQAGWYPIAQSYAEGGHVTWILVLGIIGLLFLLLPGIIIIIIWAVHRSPGSLTATYQFRPPPPR